MHPMFSPSRPRTAETVRFPRARTRRDEFFTHGSWLHAAFLIGSVDKTA